MSRADALMQYQNALKLGQKYYKEAVAKGEAPYPPALTDILDENTVSKVELGLVNVPSELIVGTYAPGRQSAMSADFMPLLSLDSEFAAKWVSLCAAHLSDEGIRDPIKCFEYLGRFYVQEGNKRASVLKSYEAPTIPAIVTRLVPPLSDDHEVQIYYEFMHFYSLTGIYGLRFIHRKQYAKLCAALGFDGEHVWTDDERRSFRAGYSHFKSAFDKVCPAGSNVTAAEAFLYWLSVYTFAQTKDMLQKDIVKNLDALWDKIEAENDFAIDISTQPVEKSPSIITKLKGMTSGALNIAFIYGFDPQTSDWTRAHELGRKHIEEHYGEKISVRVYKAENKEYFAPMKKAVEDGAELIFATIPTMIDAAKRLAVLHPSVKIHVCSLSRPHAGVRNYYSRIYESKFISGAIAGAMADNDRIGYIANYPIMGVPPAINAFALGVKLTNPRARIVLRWSCVEGDHLLDFIENDVCVVSNRDISGVMNAPRTYDWGVYRMSSEGLQQRLAFPMWNWGVLYEKIVESVFNGSWNDHSLGRAINYWWGMKAGVVDIVLGSGLPSGVKTLAEILRRGIIDESVKPFSGRLRDNQGNIRSDGSRELRADEIMAMDWLLDNVDGEIPPFDKLLDISKDTVRLLGVYRHELPPEKKEEKQI